MTLKDTFKYRHVWMGFAILWIVLFHTNLYFDSRTLQTVVHLGYGGVDIFFFASGIGNYYSYLKDKSPLDFLSRKIKRIFPSYIPFIIVWLIYSFLTHKTSNAVIIGNLFGIQGLTNNGGEFNWFISAILVFYLLTPYFASFIEKNSTKYSILLLILIIIISFVFWGDSKIISSVTRLPVFITGMLFAKNESTKLTKKFLVFSSICFVIAIWSLVTLYNTFFEKEYMFLDTYGLFWYPFMIIAPLICIFISILSSIIENNSKKWTILSIPLHGLQCLGTYSFEIYLCHILIFDVLLFFSKKAPTVLEFILAFLVSIGLALLLNKHARVIKTNILKE